MLRTSGHRPAAFGPCERRLSDGIVAAVTAQNFGGKQLPRYRIPQLKLRPDHEWADIERKIIAVLGVTKDSLVSWKIDRKSFDAREKTDIRIIYGVTVELKTPAKGPGKGREWLPVAGEEEYAFPSPRGTGSPGKRPVIVGSGPAGLFCALILAENGYAPLVLERGEDVESRMRSVRRFWETGELKPDSNMQFGEGGAGTFSDGKLNTSIADREHQNAKVLGEFVEAGAPPEIAYSNKPHIGTDYLFTVVGNIRKKIESLGGIVRFNAKVTSFGIESGGIRSVTVNGSECIEAPVLVLAIGHSARDSFEELSRGPTRMEQKPFAIGLRIEHPQEMIQRNQFGPFWNHPKLPVADYKLSHQSSGGRGVYSFCMCPGGFVVNSSSEAGMVVCNGMSNFARNERNANSAIVVAVRTEDFGGSGVLAGIEFQRRWEKAAFLAANGRAANGGRAADDKPAANGGGAFAMPVQRLGDFFAGIPSTRLGVIKPCSRGGYSLSDLNGCLPGFVAGAIKEGIQVFDRRIKGFAHPDAVLTGVETRTSSPLRILRDASLQSNVAGLYPCGEGAGYAGGIMSAAMDGIRVAEAVARTISRGANP